MALIYLRQLLSQSPVILQACAGARKYAGEPYRTALAACRRSGSPSFASMAATSRRPTEVNIDTDIRLAMTGAMRPQRIAPEVMVKRYH
jgi:fructose/tagatose bisphosphate aldolase